MLNGIGLADPLLTFNCSPVQPGWYCGLEIMTLLARYSEAAAPETRRPLADKLQAAAHSDVTFVVGGQFAAPGAWRSSLSGVVPFSFLLFRGVEKH